MSRIKLPEKKYNFIYETVHRKTGKFYIGRHSTDNLDDNYIGSGTILWNYIRKYGKKEFDFRIREFFPNRKLLKEREKEIVNKELLSNKMCLNIMEGGEGGDTRTNHPRREEIRQKHIVWYERISEEEKKKYFEKMSFSVKQSHRLYSENQSKGRRKVVNIRKLRGHWHSLETKRKISENNGSIRPEVKEKISQTLTGRRKEDFEYLQKHSEKMTKTFILIYPNGNKEIILGKKNVKKKTKELKISNSLIFNFLNETITENEIKGYISQQRNNTIGFQLSDNIEKSSVQ